MKYLVILTLLACLSCQSGTTRQAVEAATGDSVLYSSLIVPYTDSIQQFPDKHELYYRRGLLLFNTHPRLAQLDFEKAGTLSPGGTDYWAGAGEAALLNNDNAKAVTYFSKALKTVPNYAYLQYRLATAMVENQQYKQADSLADILAHGDGPRNQAYYLKARIAEDRKDTASAIKHLTTAVTIAGLQSEYDAVMELADLLQAKHIPSALQYYDLAYQLDSTNASPLYSKGQFLETLGKTSAAIQAYRQCILTDPVFEDAYLALGKISLTQQHWKEGLQYFNMAAKTAPTNADAYYFRALCYEKMGNKVVAVEDYTKALSFRKDFPAAQEALQRLK
jgi:tetratricopeptide (TPR) repeat protein